MRDFAVATNDRRRGRGAGSDRLVLGRSSSVVGNVPRHAPMGAPPTPATCTKIVDEHRDELARRLQLDR